MDTNSVRVRVRINGASGGVLLSFDQGNVTDDEFIKCAIEKLGVPAFDDRSKVGPTPNDAGAG
jgi:hypothetical protein